MSDKKQMPHEDLRHEANLLEQEARMILPGIQTLFGFQLVTAFNDHFIDRLTHNEHDFNSLREGFKLLATLDTDATGDGGVD